MTDQQKTVKVYLILKQTKIKRIFIAFYLKFSRLSYKPMLFTYGFLRTVALIIFSILFLNIIHALQVPDRIFTDDIDAVKQLKIYIKDNPKNAKAYFRLGWYQQKMDYNKEAEDSYQKCLKLKPDYFAALVNLANIYKSAGEMQKAEKLYKEAIVSNPNHPEGYYNLGTWYMYNKNFKAAGANFRRTLELDSKHKEALLNLGTILLEQYKQSHDETSIRHAIVYFNKARENSKGYAHVFYNLGLAYELLNQPGVAIKFYREAVRYYPAWSKWRHLAQRKINDLSKRH